MKAEKDVFSNFTLPKGAKFMVYANYIPGYMGQQMPTFIRFYHTPEDARGDIEKLEKDGSVNAIYIAHVIKEHLNAHR